MSKGGRQMSSCINAAQTTRKRARFVWVVDDEKYGWQGIFSSKRKAEKALPRLHIGGFGCIVQKVKVQ